MPAKTSDAVRKAVLKDYLMGGDSQKEVAGRHGVPLSTFQMWLKAERGSAPIAKKTLAVDDEPMGSGIMVGGVETGDTPKEALMKGIIQAGIARENRLREENALLRQLVHHFLRWESE